MIRKVAYCPDCGPASVAHIFEKSAVVFDTFFSPVAKPMDWIWRKTEPFVKRLHPSRFLLGFFKLLAAIKIGQILSEPDEANSDRTKVLWIEAKARGIKMHEFRLFGLARDIYFAEYKGKAIVWDGLPRPSYLSSSLTWMDDKGAMKKHFIEARIPVARGRACFSENAALETFREFTPPFIVKPNVGSRSRHTTIHIKTEEQLLSAFRKAKQLSPWAIVEEELDGMVYRVTLIHKKVAAVMRREPPFVMGDGQHSVEALVAEENKNPLRQGPIFHTMTIDEEAIEELKRQDLTPKSVPEKNRMVTLNQKVSRAYGATTTDVTDDVHFENLELFQHIGEILEDDLVGVDFIIEDMSRSWKEQPRSGVIECNSCPFIDLHHYPYKGEPRNVAGELWDLIYPESATR